MKGEIRNEKGQFVKGQIPWNRHGFKKTPEYNSWRGMRGRCNEPSHMSYRYYGGRGIKVCERWNDFLNFYADMGPKPDKSYTIDRVDGDGDYSPDNCRWATRKEQQANKKHTNPVQGVSYDKTNRKWKAYISVPGGQIHLGRFKDLQDAITKVKEYNGG